MFMRLIYSFIILLVSAATVIAEPTRVEHVVTEFITDYTQATPGQTLRLGWRLTMDPHWHVYWQNPGDSGLPAQIDWQLPTGTQTGDLRWPTPERITIPPITNYGYENEVILITPITLPTTLNEGQTLTLSGHVSFLMCKDVCLPGEATLSTDIALHSTPIRNQAVWQTFNQTETTYPVPLAKETVHIGQQANTYTFTIPADILGEKIHNLRFIPDQEEWIDDSAPQNLMLNNASYTLTVPMDPWAEKHPTNLSGVLLVNEVQGFHFTAPIQQALPLATPTTSLILIIALAFVAGLILNLMPCVLPVLSLKVLAIIKHRESGQATSHAIIYTLGIILSFWLVAGALLALQAAGQAIGWGFQLQEPLVIAALAGVFTLLALNLFGVFEWGTSLTRLENKNTTKSPLLGTFFSGVLMTIVATPCTVPFMGTAVAYALTQPLPTTFTVFTSMGIGLAAPYLLFSLMPNLLRWLPKPGAWLITFKQFLAFPLLATVAWLVWVFVSQAGSMALLYLLTALLCIALGAWVFGKLPNRKLLALGILLTSILFAGWLVTLPAKATHKTLAQPWSVTAQQAALAQQQPTFVNFTADWCVTCKANEALVLNRTAVTELFEQHAVQYLKGDWTSYDPAITAELSRFGRKGVPLYIMYIPGREPLVLPQILSFSALQDALEPQQ